ncbi:MAG TPA: hypothetical protein VJ806_05390 [Luteimonas sp.]|nr:hypothetical protein [Luteimonas sp.]
MSFDELEAKAAAYVKITHEEPPGKVERWSFALGMFFGGTGLLVGTLVGGRTGSIITLAALALELLGLGTSAVLQIKRHWASFRRSRQTYARELDADFIHYQRIIDWLRTFPFADLERKLHYLRARKASLSYRLGLATGGIERLGVLPMVVVLYLQFKDWEFGDWQALGEVNMVGGLLVWALLLIYVGAWHLIGLRTRMDLYDSLLTEAVRDREE